MDIPLHAKSILPQAPPSTQGLPLNVRVWPGGVFLTPQAHRDKEYKDEAGRQFHLARRKYTFEERAGGLRGWFCQEVWGAGLQVQIIHLLWLCACSYSHAHRKTQGGREGEILMIIWMGQGCSGTCLGVLCADVSLGDFLTVFSF